MKIHRHQREPDALEGLKERKKKKLKNGWRIEFQGSRNESYLSRSNMVGHMKRNLGSSYGFK